jgi:nucleoside-diphosphate-sugar epimerase
MIVAVTGSNGFIGQHLVRRFDAASWEVRAVTRRDIELGRTGEVFSGADVVVHAAGATRAPSISQLRASNVELTARMLAAAREARVGRFIFVSSLAAAGPAQSLDSPITDATPPSPIEAYGRSKLDAETLVRSADLQSVIVRPAAVYGPGDRDFLSLFRLARRGIAIYPANREYWLSIIHVADLADAIVSCASSPTAPGRIYCLANDAPVQWAELFRLAARCAGRDLMIDLEIPAPLVDAGACVGDLAARLTGRAGLLTSEKVALSKARFWTCSSELAARELGFSAATPLQEGLCSTQQWYLEHGWL